MTTALTLSAIQYTALDGGIPANVLEHVRLIEDADGHGARLVVFPELSLTGYDLEALADPGQWVSAGGPAARRPARNLPADRDHRGRRGPVP